MRRVGRLIGRTVANAPCIEHGYDLANELDQMKMAVEAGYWMLYRYDPRRLISGQKPMEIDSKAPSIALDSYFMNENRFRLVKRRDPDLYEKLLKSATAEVRWRRTVFEKLAEMSLSHADADAAMQAAE